MFTGKLALVGDRLGSAVNTLHELKVHPPNIQVSRIPRFLLPLGMKLNKPLKFLQDFFKWPFVLLSLRLLLAHEGKRIREFKGATSLLVILLLV